MDPLTIVRGVIAGLGATTGMTLLEIAARAQWGPEVLLDWHVNEAIARRIRKSPGLAVARLGLSLHFLDGLLAGVVFILVVPFFPSGIPMQVLGLGYGIVLAAITVGVYKTIMGMSPPSGRHGGSPLPVTLVTHGAYGVILALLVVWP